MGGEGLPPYPTIPAPSTPKIPNPLNPLKINPRNLVHPLPGRAYARPMLNLARLSQHPLLAPYFEVVNPFFWPVLIWQLMKIAGEVTAAGGREALIHISWWGGVRIEYIAAADPGPSAYGPMERTRKAWDDPSWSSAVPVDLLQAQPLFFPRASGGSGRALSALTKGACARPAHADTS